MNCSPRSPLIFLAVGSGAQAACSDTLSTLNASARKVRGSNSTTLANSGTTTMANSKRKRSVLPPRYSSRAARFRSYAFFFIPAHMMINRHTSQNHSGDPIIPMITLWIFGRYFQKDGRSQWRTAFAKLICLLHRAQPIQHPDPPPPTSGSSSADI